VNDVIISSHFGGHPRSLGLPPFDSPCVNVTSIYHFLLVFCSNYISILHRFQNITAVTVHVTACDLEKSFSFDKTVEITSHVCFPIHVYSFIGLLVTSYDWCKQRFGQVRRPLPFTSNTLSCLICEQKHELNSVSTEHEVLHGVVVSACCRYNTISTIKSVITSPLFPPVSGVKYCDQRFCMTVCLSVRWYVSKTTYRYPNFTKLSVLVSCYFGPWLGPPHDGNAICSICYVFPVL